MQVVQPEHVQVDLRVMERVVEARTFPISVQHSAPIRLVSRVTPTPRRVVAGPAVLGAPWCRASWSTWRARLRPSGNYCWRFAKGFAVWTGRSASLQGRPGREQRGDAPPQE